MARKRHAIFVLPLIIFAFSLLGGFYGPRIPVASAATEGDSSERVLNQEVDGFAKFYAVVEQNFADPVKPDKAIYKGAIPGMLRTLDPHSNFFDPKRLPGHPAKTRRARYYGVGMSGLGAQRQDDRHRAVPRLARV